VPDPVARADEREEDAKKLSKRDADRSDGSGLDDKEERPSVQKATKWAERLAQIDVLAARPRHHRGQFPVAECADDGHRGGDQPRGDQQRGRTNNAAHVSRDNEDSRADHRTHHDGCGAEQAHAAHKVRRRVGVIPQRNGGICFCFA